jgi:hypothetical protein
MNGLQTIANITISVLVLLAIPVFVSASQAVPSIYTPDSFITSYHDRPLSFERDRFGNFSGVTESGKTFTQTYVASTISVRLQRFSIDDTSFYISDRGIINASSDIEALSIYLTIVGWV